MWYIAGVIAQWVISHDEMSSMKQMIEFDSEKIKAQQELIATQKKRIAELKSDLAWNENYINFMRDHK